MDKNKQSFAVGASYMLLSATGMSLVGLFGKLGNQILELDALVFWRFVAGFGVCLILLWMMREIHEGIWIKNWGMHILRAIFVLVAQYAFYYYIQRGTLLNGTMLLNTGPLFIPIIEWAIWRKTVGKSTWIAVLVSFIGMLCILQPDRGIFSLLSAVGLMAGICQAFSQVIFGINSQEERSDLGVLYLMFFCMVLSLGPFLVSGSRWIGNPSPLWPAAVLILGLGVASVFNQMARAMAYQHGTPSRLAVFLYFSVIMAGFWDWLAFGQVPNWLSLLGGVLVVGGGVLKIYLRKKQ